MIAFMVQTEIARRSARLVLISTLLNSLWFTLPVWFLYSTRELHLSALTAVNLNILIWVVSLLFNAPTGALADRFGRKLTYLSGIVLASIMPLAFALRLSLPLLVAATCVAGIGQAIMSGALLPIVHRHYEKAGLLGRPYRNFLSSSMVVFYMGRIVNGFAGAWLFSIDPRYPFIATLVAFGLNFITVTFLRDIQPENKTTETLRHIRATATALAHTPLIRNMMLLYVAIDISGEAVWTACQALFAADGRSVSTIGWLFTAIAACSAIGSYAYRHVVSNNHPYSIFMFSALCMLASTFLLWQPHTSLRLLAVVPSGLIFGTTVIALNDVAQRILANKFHSTALSLLASLKIATFIVASFLIGLVIDKFGVQSARDVMFYSSVILAAICAPFLWRHRGDKPLGQLGSTP